MKDQSHLTDRTTGLKASSELLKKPVTLYACCGLLGLIAVVFLYRPLLIKLHEAAGRLSETETELLRQRAALSASQKSDKIGEIRLESEPALMIADLADKGRELGVNFGSISPGDLRPTTQVDVGILPVAYVVESKYKNIGEFFAYVEDYSRSIAEVESFRIHVRKEVLPELDAELVLNLYVDMEDAATKH